MSDTDDSGVLVVLSGPSGAGKTSVVRALKKDPRVAFSVSATTRPRRHGEVDGVDYWFLSREEFDARVAEGAFLEWADYSGNSYGTLRAPMEQALAQGQTFVLEIEVEGTRQLRDDKVEGIYVFIVPPSEEALRVRLSKRGQNSPEEIDRRIAIARSEMESQHLYDHVVENHDLEETVQEVRRILGL